MSQLIGIIKKIIIIKRLLNILFTSILYALTLLILHALNKSELNKKEREKVGKNI